MQKKILVLALACLSLNSFAAIDAQQAVEIAEKQGFKPEMIRKIEKDGKTFFAVRRSFSDMNLRIDAESGEVLVNKKAKNSEPKFSFKDALKKACEEGELISLSYMNKGKFPPPPKGEVKGENPAQELSKEEHFGFYIAKVLKEEKEEILLFSAENGEVLPEKESLEIKEFIQKMQTHKKAKKMPLKPEVKEETKE